MDFRGWLEKELKERRYSQGQLAESIGVSQPFISRLLKGEKKPSADFCVRLAEVFELTPEHVMRIAGILPPALGDNATLQELMDIARQLPPEAQQELLDYARFKFRRSP